MTSHSVEAGRQWEEWVAYQLSQRGHSPEIIPTGKQRGPELRYDILVNKTIRVEVKSCTPKPTTVFGKQTNRINWMAVWKSASPLRLHKPFFDFCVGIAAFDNPIAFIIPAAYTIENIHFLYPEWGYQEMAYQAFEGRWDLIDRALWGFGKIKQSQPRKHRANFRLLRVRHSQA